MTPTSRVVPVGSGEAPWYSRGGVAIHVGHVLDVLAQLPAESCQVVVTSPPYWGLRAYGTEPVIWGGDPSCSHSLEATAPVKVLTGGTGTASGKQVTNAGSQYGNALMEAGALPGEVGSVVTVDRLSETAATTDVQVDAERSRLALQGGVEAMSSEEQHQVVCEETATSAEGCASSLIDAAIPVEDAADEIPHEGLSNRGQANGEALTGQEIPSGQPLNQRLTPEMPAVGVGAVRGLFDVDGGTGAQEVPNEHGATFVQAHEIDRSRLADVAIREHQAQPIGEVEAHGVETLPQDSVPPLCAYEVGSMGTTRAGNGAKSPQPLSVPMPTGAQESLTAPLTDDLDAGIPSTALASDGAMLTDDGFVLRDDEGIPTDRANQRDIHTPMICKKCGAIKCELGSEPRADCLALLRGEEPCGQCYVCHLVTVFRAVRRVLHPTGTVWCNLGDSYSANGTTGGGSPVDVRRDGRNTTPGDRVRGRDPERKRCPPGLGPKQLMMLPARVALALQADGWTLRQQLIWSKPNPMPESVQDRCTTAHEYIYLLAKSPRYYFDATAIAEPSIHEGAFVQTNGNAGMDEGYDGHRTRDGFRRGVTVAATRNRRSVWTIPTHAYPGAHFATFSPKLVEPCVLAGTSARGQCPRCGAPWIRSQHATTESTYAQIKREHGITYQDMRAEATANGITPGNVGGTHRPGRRGETFVPIQRQTTGWESSCSCGLYKCATCSIVIEYKHGQRTQTSTTDGVLLQEPRATAATTPREIQERPSGTRGDVPSPGSAALSEGLRELRAGIPSQSSQQHPMQPGLSWEVDSQEPQDDDGPREDDTRLHIAIHARPSNGHEGGLHHGASPSDGAIAGAPTDEGRSSTPSGWEQVEQRTRESGSDAEESARQLHAENAGPTGDVPSVQSRVPALRQCPQCEAPLTWEPFPTEPQVILDPFLGSGTSAYVARHHGRRAIGVELNEEYARLAADRLKQGTLGLELW